MPERPGDLLLEVCSSAQRLVIAAPYVKVDALNVVLSNATSDASLVCITRWRPEDLIVGASDTGCRTLITQRRGSFRLHPSLHAKYYRIDGLVLVGSANLTSSAMGWTPQPNLEILCRAGDDFDPHNFEQELLRDSREMSDAEFTCWESLIKINVENNSAIVSALPLLDTWRPATRDPRNLELAYQGREDEIASFDEQRAARRDIQKLSIPPGLTAEAVRAWISTCLLATPFTNSVIRLSDSDAENVAGSLAETYGLSTTAARRDMEIVQNWLLFLAPEVLAGSA